MYPVMETGQLVTILFMAMALGMDAFSVGLGIGMKGVRLLDILKISTVVGMFHIIMPVIGIATGRYLGGLLGSIAIITGGGLMVVLGLHMIYSALKGDEVRSFNHQSLLGILLFAFGVSIDSFSVGISLGIFASDLLLSVFTFGVFGGSMSLIGLYLGRRVHAWLGEYGEVFGGAILFVLGMKFIL
ncbi:manganese efflux pump MntP family protein [Marinicrinis lubricantis]|uniref:Putative manganese efflux pump MntP n=1 Tax=Marinicrinis lubricantis TaxID=2086470 RepID=A0ABW1IKB5_9BACL